MASVNSYRYSYPQIRPRVYWYQPDPEAFPPQMGFDPAKLHSVQGNWPYSTDVCPTPSNGNGNHMTFPGYFHNSPPPYTGFYQPQPCYYWGFNPGLFEPNPTRGGQTMDAPYVMDRVNSEGQFHHCCGCTNHVCNPKGVSSIKIEEHESGLEWKVGYSSDGRNSMIPMNFKNYPYPVMWIPPNFLKSNDLSLGRESGKGMGYADEEVHPAWKFLLEKPKLNGGFPLEMRDKHHFMSPHDLTSEHYEQREDEGRELQLPIIRVPSWDEKIEEGKEKNDALSCSSIAATSSDADARNNSGWRMIPRDMRERNEGKQYEKKVKVIEVTSDPSEAKDQKVDVVYPENKKIHKSSFSDSEAATLIQTAYRGNATRKWHSLQKLKQLAGVREGLMKIKNNLEELKLLNDSLCDANKFEKQRSVVGELAMSLLLQLDTIQGVHPSLRDVRKSLARELVGLQEEIDTLACNSSNASREEYEGARVEKSVPEINHTQNMADAVDENADVTDAEGGFCNQTTLKVHEEGVLMCSDAFQMNVAEASDFEGKTDCTLNASVSVPLSALPGNIVPENRLHEEGREVVPSPQEEDESSVPLFLVSEHNVPENCLHEDGETISSLQEVGQVNPPHDNSNPSVLAYVHLCQQPEMEGKPNQEEIWMKTSAMGKVEDNKKLIRNDFVEEQNLKEEVLSSPSTTGCEYQYQEVKTPEDSDEAVGLQEQSSAERGNSTVGIPGELIGSSVKIMEENDKLRLTMEKLMEVGKEQIDAIARLTARVRDLETKLSKSTKSRTRRYRTSVTLHRMTNGKIC